MLSDSDSDIKNGLYNIPARSIDRFYFFSDEEGNLPFCEDTGYHLKNSKLTDATNAYTQVQLFQTDLQSISNHMALGCGHPSSLEKKPVNIGLCYLGDLVDGGPLSTRMLLGMLERKKDYPNKTVLILGNRDINKIKLLQLYQIN